MTDEKTFNLLHEDWILVRTPDGGIDEVSLLNLFRNAQNYQGLAGELPTQDVAMLRLLLAVLYAALADDNNYPEDYDQALDRWESLWDNKKFPMEAIEKYLMRFEERFWLFHPEHPFYQVAPKDPVTDQGKNILPSSKEAKFFIGDIAESGNKVRLFSSRTQKDSVSYPEAARWLIHTNSFDASPGGRPSSTGITIKGYGLAWLSQLGLIWASGSNLFETLMLNFVVTANGQTWDKPEVIWEQENTYDAEFLLDTEPVFPKEPGKLLTTQFRRIQLIRCEERRAVTGYLLWSGQSLEIEHATNLEMMTVWRRNKDGNVVPQLHDESRQMWRDFSAIFSVSAKKDRPGIVNWIDLLKSDGLVQLPFVRFNTAGVKYTQRTTVSDVFTDNLQINLSLFTSLGETWVNRIIDEIETTEKLVNQVAYLAQNLAKAAGDSDGYGERDSAKEQAYFRLDVPFRCWLGEIDPEQHSIDDSCNHWRDQAKTIIRNLGKELVDQSGPQAFVGRYVTEKIRGREVERRYTAPEAYNQFLYWTFKH